VNIEIINTGSELMLGYVLNTHQQWLCRELSRCGHVVSRQLAVSDAGPDIQNAVREAMTRARLIITTGGLGPTSDDRTRDLIAALLGRTLREDPAIVSHIEEFFGRRKRPVPASVRVQALVPENAIVLMNRHGTAPGLALEYPGGLLVMLPGPPRELRPMFLEQVVPLIQAKFDRPANYACCVLKTTGMGESFVEQKIAPRLGELVTAGLEIGYCARTGEVDVRFVARGSEAARVIEEAERIARDELRGFIYGKDPESLETVTVRLLAASRSTLALAESCTGGFIAHRITNVPGASDVFLGGLVTYGNAAKINFLGVRPETLAAHGAVSDATVREMAEGSRLRNDADYALAVTGIAGPGGGTAEKPVGTVFIALASRGGIKVKQMLNDYDRETFKYVTSQQALDMLRRKLSKGGARCT
jgi:nicotinamide-nucleotide amidase